MKFGWQMGGKKPSKGVSYGVNYLYFTALALLCENISINGGYGYVYTQ